MEGNGRSGFLFFVWSAAGYQLIERTGDPPRPGTEVEDGDQRYRVTGDLTIKAITGPIDLDLAYQGNCVDPYSQLRVGIEGSGSLKRSDWGLTWNAALEAGGVVLSDRIDLELDISAIKVD